jgi:methionyl-tRNA formyltransferase
MNIVIFGYRQWAHNVWAHLGNCLNPHGHKIYLSQERNILKIAQEYDAQLLLFIGWSWMVKSDVLDKYRCLCIHPSPLPKYRGGSPIQHQILNGETKSAVSLFEMTEGIDDGPIVAQEPFSLEGDLNLIFKNIEYASVRLIAEHILNTTTLKTPKQQDESQATTFKRRKPIESKLEWKDFVEWDLERLYNFIRCLTDPYPNAYIEDENGNRLLFSGVRYIKGDNSGI